MRMSTLLKTTELKTIPGDQTILSQKWIATMMNILKSLKVSHHILLDYLILTLNPLDINTLGKSWRDYTPKIFVLDKLSPDNPILEEMANALSPAILRTTIPIPIALNAKETFSMEQLSTIVPYLHAKNLICHGSSF